jgi:NADP-dependent 3-hydroxy acid dehydrogenase YdfG
MSRSSEEERFFFIFIFQTKQMKTVFITGATSGIGEACARAFAGLSYNIILHGRNADKLASLKKELSHHVEVETLEFDVRDRDELMLKIQDLLNKEISIDILINNAGNAHGLEKLQDGSYKDWDAMMDINVKGLLYITEAVLPTMISKNRGHILNVGSLAAKDVYANGTVYCASKKAVDAITEGLRKDLHETDIKVGAIHPGLVETNFSDVRFKGDSERAKAVYQGYKALQSQDIAEIIVFMVTRPVHVNIADLLVLPSAQSSSTMVKKNG